MGFRDGQNCDAPPPALAPPSLRAAGSAVTRRVLPGILTALAAAPLAGCIYTYTYRYRLTLFVETPEGVKTGSGVIENHWVRNDLPIPFTGRMSVKDRGEAVAVDLGARGVVFAVLGDVHGLPLKVFQRTKAIRDDTKIVNNYAAPGTLMRQLETLQASAELDREEIPFLVRFRDLDDPKSAEAVDREDLAASFGPGVRLLGATIEMTSDPVTTGIEKRLPWVPRLHGSIGHMLGMQLPPHQILNQLNDGSFWQGTRQ